MLEIRNVHKTFNPGTINEKHALNGVNLKLEEGDFVTVIGGNGAGKSTMMKCLFGTYQKDEGTIILTMVQFSSMEWMSQDFLSSSVHHFWDVCFRIQ